MKIRFLKGTTLGGGKPANPGEVHDVTPEDAQRFVHQWKDAEYVLEEAPKAVEEPPKAEASEPPAAPADEPVKESTKGKKK